MSEFTISTDLFLLPNDEGKTVLYAPLAGFVCHGNEDLVALLRDLETLRSEELSAAQKEIVDYLIRRGIVNGAEKRPIPARSGDLAPTKLTLFPTDQCNLQCIYCYASGTRTHRRIMDWETASSAVEYYLGYLSRTGKEVFDLEFHGGGEPFVAWDLIRRIVDFAQSRCSRLNKELKVCASTNGMLPESQLAWITEHFDSLIVSFDVLPRVQQFHRPSGIEGDSFRVVHNTLKCLDRKGFRYGIRCTVSTFNLELLGESLDFVIQNYGCRLLYLEPVSACGPNGKLHKSLVPDLHRFAEIYQSLEPLASGHGLSLGYSGARFDRLTPHFCYVGTDDFAVTADGLLTNCWQVTSADDPMASTFIFGSILPGGTLSCDAHKLEALRSLTVLNYSYCADCFAKWHCAGDCVVKLGDDDLAGGRNNDRCETTRRLIAGRIAKLLEREEYYEKV